MATVSTHKEGLGYVLLAGIAAAAAGTVATAPSAAVVLGALGAGAALFTLARYFGVGVIIGVLLLAGVDALPGPNLETVHVAFTIRGQDLVVFLLVCVLVVENIRARGAVLSTPASRAIAYWAVGFLALWAAIAVHTGLTTETPLLRAMFTGRDFAYFAIVMPLLIAPLRRPSIRQATLITCGVGAVFSSTALVLVSLNAASLSLVVHSIHSTSIGGLTRIYTGAIALSVAGFPLGVGFLLLGRERRVRLAGAVLAFTCGLAVGLSLTRALYLGEVAGLATAIGLWLVLRDPMAHLARRQLARLLGVGVAASIALAVYSPPSVVNTAVGGVSQRIASIVPDLSQPSGAKNTIAVRAAETSALEYRLGSHWLLGLGFLDPTYDYNPDLPGGSIRNPDVGILNTVMTMGLIGTVIYYVPLLMVGAGLAYRRLSGDVGSGDAAALSFGLFAWIVAALLSSVTLVILFSPTGVVSAATVLALGVVAIERTSVSPDRRPRGSKPTPSGRRQPGVRASAVRTL